MAQDKSRRRFTKLAAALPALLMTGMSNAFQRTARPVADFFRFPDVTGVSLAPGGQALLGIREVKGRRNLLVVDLKSRKASIITNFRDGDVTSARWINDRRIVFTVGDLSRGSGDQLSAGRLLAINKDSSEFRELAGENSQLRHATFHSRIRESGVLTNDIFVTVFSVQALGRFSSNLYRLDTRTARATPATVGGPGRAGLWVVDRNNVPRAAVSQIEGTTAVHYRSSADAPWRVIATFGQDEPEKTVTPLAFDQTGVLYVSAYQGRELAAIFRFNPETNSIESEPLISLKDFDLTGGLRFDAAGKLIGIDYEAERQATHWFDNEWGELQSLIDASLKDRVNRLSGELKEKDAPILVTSYSDRQSPTYYLFHASRRQLEQIAASRPWINADEMSPTEFIRYRARDGLSIPALLTLPASKPPKNLPLVVLHYGGPWVRAIHWGFDENVQFLASRGYAVLMPAPRGSTGYGLRHFRLGWKQWGLSMQDDVTDGVRELIAKGIVDPKRVCIAGASYGGYLAMMGLVKEPELFKCAINWVGVTDPEFMLTVTWTDFNEIDAGRFTLPLLVGDSVKDAEQFRRTSPLRRATEIKQPVLMAYGGLDRRVPIINGNRMRDALRPHNPNVEWIVYADEGHGFLKESNNVDFWTRVEAFLAKHLG
jgi:dipeptidyl aminopeptidase/acylaminoacyl peptidase